MAAGFFMTAAASVTAMALTSDYSSDATFLHDRNSSRWTTRSSQICQCHGRKDDDTDEDDPMDHNFDGDEHIENTDRHHHHHPSSIFGGGQATRPKQRDSDFPDVIHQIAQNMSASFNTEKVTQQMKDLIDHIIIPNKDDNSSTANSSEYSPEENFKQILQSLFHIVNDTMNGTPSNDKGKNDHANGVCTIKDSVTLAVSDFLAAVQQQNRQQQQRNPLDSKNDTDHNESTTAPLLQSSDDQSSIFDLGNLLLTHSDDIHEMVTKYMSNIDYQRITPTAIAYFGEYANARYQSILEERLRRYSHSPDYNVRMLFRNWSQHHREQLQEWLGVPSGHDDDDSRHATATTEMPTMDPSIRQLIASHPDAIALASLSYVDTMEQIRDGLQNLPSQGRYQYELRHCDLKSEPGKPAHFYAIRSKAPSVSTTSNAAVTRPNHDDDDHDDTTLDVVIVIRGTKTVADAITDLLGDTEPYHRWGNAHSYILGSGRYIANLYRTVFDDVLRNRTNRISNIRVTIYGHSLGAGAGAIAAMELHDLYDSQIQVQMIGFGCPAILSKNLAAQTSDYITTFVNDSDLVPRLSGLSLTNLLYDIIEFDWMPLAQRDVHKAFDDLQKFQPILFSSDTVAKMKDTITSLLESIHHDTYLPSGTIPRVEVELYPPGKCIHIYRTGNGDQRSACYVPNWFYGQIDVNQYNIEGAYVVSFLRWSFCFHVQ